MFAGWWHLNVASPFTFCTDKSRQYPFYCMEYAEMHKLIVGCGVASLMWKQYTRMLYKTQVISGYTANENLSQCTSHSKTQDILRIKDSNRVQPADPWVTWVFKLIQVSQYGFKCTDASPTSHTYQETSGWGLASTTHSNSNVFPWTVSTLASWDLNTGRVAAITIERKLYIRAYGGSWIMQKKTVLYLVCRCPLELYASWWTWSIMLTAT